MAESTLAGGTYEVVAYKGGQEWNRTNFPAFFNSISSVRADVGGGGASSITITLTPSLIDAILILQSGILGASTADPSLLPSSGGGGSQQPSISNVGGNASATSADAPASAPSNGTYYAVRFLYPGVPEGDTPWYGGHTCQPSFDISGGLIDITVKVTGVQNMMSIMGGPVVINNESALSVLKRFASKFNVEITFDDEDTETEALLSDTKISGAFNEDYDDIIRRVLTDLFCSYVKYDGDEADPKPQYRIKSLKYLSKQPIEYHICVLRQIDPSNGQIPAELSLESAGALFAPGNAFGTFQRELITGEKRFDPYAGSPQDYKGQSDSASKADSGSVPMDTGDGLAKGGATGLVDTGGDLVAGHVAAGIKRGDLENQDRLTAVSEASRTGALVFSATCPGIPRVRPLSYVQLTVGPGDGGIEAFSGPCRVTEIAHECNDSGWTTTLKLFKTGGPTYNASATPKKGEAPKAPNKGAIKQATDIP